MKKTFTHLLIVLAVIVAFSGMVVTGYCIDDTEPRNVTTVQPVK